MLHHRMATKRSIFALLWFITLSHALEVVLPTLRLEIANFIPGCAQQCFRSFLAVNYGLNPCGRLPSLQCLCRRNGASGFTVSEGALQCITAERLLGSCSSFEASDSVIRTALGICDDVEDAVQPTHTVITATVVLPPSGSGAVTVPPIETTSSPTSSPLTTRTTSSVSTRRTSSTRPLTTPRPRTSSSTTFSTTVRPSSTETQSVTLAPPPPVPPPGEGTADKASTKESLNTPQVVGISIGVAAAAAFAIGAIFVARYYRRKKYPGVKTGFFPTRDTWGYNVEKGPDNESSSWLGRHTTSGPSPDPLPPLPPAYLNKTWRPSDASPATASPSSQRRNATQASPSRRMSKLLPAKPVLQLAVPMKTPSPSSSQSQPRSSPGRLSPGRYSPAKPLPPKPTAAKQSTRAAAVGKARAPTQLKLQIPGQNNPLPPLPLVQHRRDSTMTEFEEDGGTSMSPNGQIWRPPSAGPLSATTYYVADKNGNWVLGGPKSASHVAELDGSPAEPKSSGTTGRPLPAQPQPVKPRAGVPPSEPKPTQKRSLGPPAEIKSAAELAGRPPNEYQAGGNVPRPLFSSNQNLRRQSTHRSTSRSFGRPRAASSDSGVTTICTSPDDNNIRELPTPIPMSTPLALPLPPQPTYLSPVVESPRSKSGNSPKINPDEPARHRNVAAGRNLNILPPNKRNLLYSPPGQPSPTLGIMQPGQNTNKPMNPRGQRPPMQNPGLVRTGSPTMRVVRASPEVDDRTMLPSVRPSRLQQPAMGPKPPSVRAPHPLSNVSNVPPRRTSQQFPLPPLQTSNMPPPSVPAAEQSRPRLSSTDLHSPSSERTASTGSSLLAKRVGSDRAANMAIPTSHPSSAAYRWRRDDFPPPGVPMTPRLPGDLPATPTWVPRLTPTRRGDDLFLNVQ